MKDELTSSVASLGDDSRVQDLLNRVCALTDMGFAAVAYVSDKYGGSRARSRTASRSGSSRATNCEIKKTICDEIRCSGKPIAIDDTTKDPDWWNHPVPTLYGFRSYVSLPIVIDGKFFGTLCAIDDALARAPVPADHQRTRTHGARTGRAAWPPVAGAVSPQLSGRLRLPSRRGLRLPSRRRLRAPAAPASAARHGPPLFPPRHDRHLVGRKPLPHLVGDRGVRRRGDGRDRHDPGRRRDDHPQGL